MPSSTILLSITDGVAEVTLNRPDKLNSFTRVMHAELRAALAAIRDDASLRAILITGAGRGFCAGQDLDDVIDPVTGKPGTVSNTLMEDYNPLIRALHEGPLPVVCAVNGVAAGAGANIALACDIVLAARSAVFLQAFAKIGLVPDAGGSGAISLSAATGVVGRPSRLQPTASRTNNVDESNRTPQTLPRVGASREVRERT